MANRNWRLPAGVDELLPPEAWSLEQVRRRVLDIFRSWGFEFVDPPVVEYLDSLLVGVSEDMDLQTLKAVDQRSGKLLGVRSDMTSQAVRIDAHSLARQGVQRLSYAGNVVLANPAASLDSRVPLKAGAELFGTMSLAADAEIISLMLEALSACGISDPIVVIGHMGIYQRLVREFDLSAVEESELFLSVQRKSESDIRRLLASQNQERALVCEQMVSLPGLMGEADVLEHAKRSFSQLGGELGEALNDAVDSLARLAGLVAERSDNVRLRFDLAELVGYGYHNGPVFSAYHADQGKALARGGRYDGIGAEFGRARAATGFDLNLKDLLTPQDSEKAIWVSWQEESPDERHEEMPGESSATSQSLLAVIAQHRAEGDIVVCALSADDVPDPRCDRQLICGANGWLVADLPSAQAVRGD